MVTKIINNNICDCNWFNNLESTKTKTVDFKKNTEKT